METTLTGPGTMTLGSHKAAIHLVLLADLLYSSRFYRLWNPALMQPLLLGILLCLILVYTGIAWLHGHFGRALMAAAGYGVIVVQMYVFSSLFNTEIQFNASFGLMLALTFIIFFVVCKEGLGPYLLDTLFRYATAYVLLYALLSAAFMVSIVPAGWVEAIRSDDAERGGRLFGYLVACCYALFTWLQRARRRSSRWDLVMVVVCVVAVTLALSRTITVLLIAMSAAVVLNTSERAVRVASLTVLGIASATHLFGFIDPEWNPYHFVAGDSSGGFRMWEYELARDMISHHPVTGIGFAPSQWHAWSNLNYDYFAASDLGVMGVWFDWGLLGMVLFMIGSFIATARMRGVEDTQGKALFHTGCLMAAYGCVAPVIFYPSGATYFAVILGGWLAAYDDRALIPRG